MTTIETLTDTQIKSLRREAGQSGDMVQKAICCVALGEEHDASTIDGLDSRLMQVNPADMTQDDARKVCLAAINEAEAQG